MLAQLNLLKNCQASLTNCTMEVGKNMALKKNQVIFKLINKIQIFKIQKKYEIFNIFI